ncbi:MAG: hypothetical protein QM692_18985 [Thermomicrobiales bacterium]
MRPLEWLFVLSFLPLIVITFGPARWRASWAPLAMAPGIIAAAQVLLEGWRWQLLALYLLAGVLLAAGALGRGEREPLGRFPRWVGGLVLLGAVAGTTLLAAWALPIITLPAPTGPYAVGAVDRMLVDPARDRRLMATVWYPAAERGAPKPFTDAPDALMAGMEHLTGLPGIVFQHMRYIDTAASDSAPLLTGEGPFPVLLFSHGMVGMRAQNSSMLQDLASWGYIVVALDHTDAAAVTAFPDGEVRFYNPASFGLPLDKAPAAGAVEANVFPVWVADQRFAIDTLEAWQADDPLFAGALDLAQLGAFGHSFGGATSLETCRVDPRCHAAADLDGGIYGALTEEPATRPLLLLSSQSSGGDEAARAKWRAVVDNAEAPALWLELPGSSHLSFTDSELLSPILPQPGFDPRAGLALAGHDVRTFFDRYLRGEDDGPYELPAVAP